MGSLATGLFNLVTMLYSFVLPFLERELGTKAVSLIAHFTCALGLIPCAFPVFQVSVRLADAIVDKLSSALFLREDSHQAHARTNTPPHKHQTPPPPAQHTHTHTNILHTHSHPMPLAIEPADSVDHVGPARIFERDYEHHPVCRAGYCHLGRVEWPHDRRAEHCAGGLADPLAACSR
jgi:hypothetical protein